MHKKVEYSPYRVLVKYGSGYGGDFGIVEIHK